MKKYKLILNDEKIIYFDYFTKKIFDLIHNNKWEALKYNAFLNKYIKTNDLYIKLNNK